jgi:unsaturated rhamnogalacturonyl hydrolase
MTTLDDLRRLADRTTDWRFHCWYWGDAIAIDGLLDAASAGAGRYQDHVGDTLERWYQSCPPNFDDVLAPGAAIVRFVMHDQLPAGAVQRLLHQLDGLPRVHGDIPALEPHRLFFRYGVCIDAVYHLPSFYALAGQLGDDVALSRRGVRIAVETMELLHCASGWAQWYDPTHRRNNGIAWSRGLGWAVLGLLDVAHIAGADAAEAADLAGRVLERLAATQLDDGNWAEVLGHAGGGSETSTAAFYVAAALHPAAKDLVALPAAVLDRAAAACRAALAPDGTFTGVTADVLPSWDIATYEHCPTEPSPWAQGAALRAFTAMLRAGRD